MCEKNEDYCKYCIGWLVKLPITFLIQLQSRLYIPSKRRIFSCSYALFFFFVIVFQTKLVIFNNNNCGHYDGFVDDDDDNGHLNMPLSQ